jgi:hypothetical protein
MKRIVIALFFLCAGLIAMSQDANKVMVSLVYYEDFNPYAELTSKKRLFYADFYFQNVSDTTVTLDLNNYLLEVVFKDGVEKIEPKGFAFSKELFIDPIAPARLKLPSQGEKEYRIFYKYPGMGRPLFIHTHQDKVMLSTKKSIRDTLYLDDRGLPVENAVFAESYQLFTEYPDRSLVFEEWDRTRGKKISKTVVENPFDLGSKSLSTYYYPNGKEQVIFRTIDHQKILLEAYDSDGTPYLESGNGVARQRANDGWLEYQCEDSIPVCIMYIDTLRGDSLYLQTPQNATYPGGMNALYKLVSRNIELPTIKKKEVIYGRVLISFVVDEEGATDDFWIEQDNLGYLGDEVISALYEMEKWKPAFVDSIPVKSLVKLPFVIDIN